MNKIVTMEKKTCFSGSSSLLLDSLQEYEMSQECQIIVLLPHTDGFRRSQRSRATTQKIGKICTRNRVNLYWIGENWDTPTMLQNILNQCLPQIMSVSYTHLTLPTKCSV